MISRRFLVALPGVPGVPGVSRVASKVAGSLALLPGKDIYPIECVEFVKDITGGCWRPTRRGARGSWG